MKKDLKPTTAEFLLELYFSLSSHLTKQLLTFSVPICLLNLYEKTSIALIIASSVSVGAIGGEFLPSQLANYFHVSSKDYWVDQSGHG